MTKAEREKKMMERLLALRGFDDRFRKSGELYLAGVDEVGRGPLAGPVVTAACVLPADFDVPGIDDSKKLTDRRRREMSRIILDRALAFGFGISTNERIDRINILEATKEAMYQAVQEAEKMLRERTGCGLDRVLVDAVNLDMLPVPVTSMTKGDATSLSIAAASIIAKVRRDDMMIAYEETYPGYDFASNKGYGTKSHYAGLKEQGISPIHRRTFLRNMEDHF